MDEPLHEQPHAVPRCSRSREIICTVCCRCFVCKEVTIVAINSLAIETQRNHKLCLHCKIVWKRRDCNCCVYMSVNTHKTLFNIHTSLFNIRYRLRQ